MATQPINESLSLTTNGRVYFQVGGYLGWGFDMNISAGSAAAGDIRIYLQYTNPDGDTTTQLEKEKYPIAAGEFEDAFTKQTIDSNNVTTAAWCIVDWQGSDANNGTITIIGYKSIF